MSRVMTHLKISSREALSSLVIDSKYSYANRREVHQLVFQKVLRHQVKMTHPGGHQAVMCHFSIFLPRPSKIIPSQKPHVTQRIVE